MKVQDIEKMVQWDRDHIVRSASPVGDTRGIIFDKGDGIYLEDIKGKKYIDGASQLVCVNLGYGNKEIIEAIKIQLDKLQYTTLFFGFSHSAIIECSERLIEVMPEGLNHLVFTCGGSESNEMAIKIARIYQAAHGKKKSKTISLYDSYHGVTNQTSIMTGSGKSAFESGSSSVAGHIKIPSYDCYNCMMGLNHPECNTACATILDEIIDREGEDTVAAFICEPEMGVAGCIPPPPDYWPIIRKICDKRDVLLISDEVMTGFCRTGKMFGIQNWDVIPDMMTMAKGITSSYLPFGAVAFNPDIFEILKSNNCIFSTFTFGGNQLGAAAATAAISIYRKEKIAEHVKTMGQYMVKRLKEFEELPCIDNVSGLGLMVGMNVVANKGTKEPYDLSMNTMKNIQNSALENGLWVRVCTRITAPSDRLMIAPPLIIDERGIDQILDILYPILKTVA